MTTFTGTNGDDSANAATIIGFTGGLAADLTDNSDDTFLGLGGTDIIVAGATNDTLNGGADADSLNGADGSDTYQFNTGDVVASELISDSGASGTDRLSLLGDVDFTPAFVIGNIEGIQFTGAQTATFKAFQFNPGGLSPNLDVIGVAGTVQNIVVNDASNFSALTWSFSNWEFFNQAELDVITINGTGFSDTITGSIGEDIISGGGGADILRGSAGADSLDGGEGSDIYEYGASEVVQGESINDTGTTGKDAVRFLEDVSFLAIGANDLSGIEAFVFTGEQHFQINSFPIFGHDFEVTGSNGTAQSFTIENANNFDISGWTFKNWEASDSVVMNGTAVGGAMVGSSQRDSISGFSGEDRLTGGLGRDTLTGGTEKDIFDYNSARDSAKGANRDVITDFSGSNVIGGDLDLIDLSTIDAKTTVKHNQAFKFIGASKFHHKAGELQVKYDANSDIAIVSGDRNGDGKADFQIEVHSTEALARDDFLL